MTEPEERVVRVGCAGLPQGTARGTFFRRVPLLEVDSLPKPATARRMRKDGAHTVLWRVSGFPVPAWKESLEAVDALGAEVVVLQTPPSFSPSAANQEAM